jgi:hypothetical protein
VDPLLRFTYKKRLNIAYFLVTLRV